MSQPASRRGTAAVLAAIALGALVLLAACSSDGGSSGAGKDDGDGTVFTPKDGDTIDVGVNEPFTVKLESNPTTGYQWAVDTIDGDVTFVESKYVAPKSDKAGAPGEQILTFDSGPEGTSTVHLVYERPFAPDEPGQSLEFDVDVAKG
jgi:inhibitor of cysteine peptidase